MLESINFISFENFHVHISKSESLARFEQQDIFIISFNDLKRARFKGHNEQTEE